MGAAPSWLGPASALSVALPPFFPTAIVRRAPAPEVRFAKARS